MLFAVTNIDDIVILTLFFGQAIGRNNVLRIVIGQYVGFSAIFAASILGAMGAGILPETGRPVAFTTVLSTMDNLLDEAGLAESAAEGPIFTAVMSREERSVKLMRELYKFGGDTDAVLAFFFERVNDE